MATGSQKQQLTEVLCLLLATVQSLIRRLSPEDVGTISDQVVANLLKLNESEGVQEDVMMTMGVLIDGKVCSLTCALSFICFLLCSAGR